MNIKKGDNVIMRSGKDRHKTGKISHVFPARDKVMVEGLNMIKKHLRPRSQEQKAQIVSRERAVAASSVQLICSKCEKPTRVGYEVKGNSKVRICKKCGGEI